jgi:Spy/CpxP family protein refolding chaperone
MKKHPIAPLLIAVAISSFAALSVSAQVRQNPNRLPRGERRIDAAGELDPQFGRRKGERRGMNMPQVGGQSKLNQAQKRKRLQQMVMQAIGLTPDQHARINDIHRGHDDERIAAGRRVRQARQALDRAVMSEQYNEAAVRRATEELAAAQGDRIRLESRIRSEVRNVLTADQVMRFHQFEREFRRRMRQQQLEQQQQTEQEKETRTESARPPQQLDELDLMSLLFLEDGGGF